MKAVKTTQLAPQEKTMAQRFMDKVIKEFTNGVGEVRLTKFQMRLAQNYFMAIDLALKKAELKRQAKKQNKDPLPVVWANINMEQLARDVVAHARIGLDPAQENHISVSFFKNHALNKYDVVFMPGYRGLELKHTKYGLDVPDIVTVELVYSSDRFKSHKKDVTHNYETYEFEIVNDFDRGEIIGGFYYHMFSKTPEKNRLVVMPLKEILKRKPRWASVEFWGGEKDVWKNGKKTGKKETVEGWYEKMCYKTVCRAAYRAITIDSQKIDNDYLALKQMEDSYTEQEVAEEIAESANKEPIGVDFEVVDGGTVDIKTGEAMSASDNGDSNEGQKEEQPQAMEPAQEEYNPSDAELAEMAAEQAGSGNPGF